MTGLEFCPPPIGVWCAADTALTVESDSILSGCPDNGTKSLWSVSASNKNSFFQLHTIVKLLFNHITIFKTRHRDKILIKICECGQWTEFAKISICIILVVLVYLESAKVYTGPKIVRVVKRLRNTGLVRKCAGKPLLYYQIRKNNVLLRCPIWQILQHAYCKFCTASSLQLTVDRQMISRESQD